jgi:hypothetical protein
VNALFVCVRDSYEHKLLCFHNCVARLKQKFACLEQIIGDKEIDARGPGLLL